MIRKLKNAMVVRGKGKKVDFVANNFHQNTNHLITWRKPH